MASILFRNRHWKLTLISVLCGTIFAHFLFNGLRFESPLSIWSGLREEAGHRVQIVSRKLDGSLVHRMVAEDRLDSTNKNSGFQSDDKNRNIGLEDDVIVGPVPYGKDGQGKRKTNSKTIEDDQRQMGEQSLPKEYDDIVEEDIVDTEVEMEKPKPEKPHKEVAYYFEEPDRTSEEGEGIFDVDDILLHKKDDENRFDAKEDEEAVDEEERTEMASEENLQKLDVTGEAVSGTDTKEEIKEDVKSIFDTTDVVKDKAMEENHDKNLIYVHPESTHAQEKRERRMNKVILLSYMRSGSSYVGSLLEKSPEVFYFYEPLYSTQVNFGHWDKFRFLDSRKISDPITMDTTPHSKGRRNRTRGAPDAYFRPDSIAVRMLRAALDCRIDDLDLDTLSQVTMGLGTRTANLRACASSGSEVDDLNAVKQCCNNASALCRKCSTIVAKVIRLSMQQAQVIMEDDQDVKLIHLIRDPRGMSLSQVYRRFYPWEFRREVGHFCTRIWQDLQQHAKLAQAFPFRTLLVRYEDVVQEPIKAMQQIFEHIGIHFGPILQKQILRMSNDKNRPHAWRAKIEAEQAKIVEGCCAPLFHIMGYREFPNNSSVRDTRFNTTADSFANGWPGEVVFVRNQPIRSSG